ncbi:MAG: hypothetical protein ACLRT4_07905 [Thomasclavelia sp.]
MKYTLKNAVLMWCFILMAALGVSAGSNLSKESNFITMYQGALSVISVRYSFIIIILTADYIVFENLNRHALICRYKSIDNFFIKSIMIEAGVSLILALMFIIPVLVFNASIYQKIFIPVIIGAFNMVVIMMLFAAFIRFINIWFTNHVLVTGLVFVVYAAIDFLFENINFIYIDNILFDFQYILALPFQYQRNYLFIVAIIAFIIVILTFSTIFLVVRRDYFLNEY